VGGGGTIYTIVISFLICLFHFSLIQNIYYSTNYILLLFNSSYCCKTSICNSMMLNTLVVEE
jgi:hypothetical protein